MTPCIEPACPNLTNGTRCPAHQRKYNRTRKVRVAGRYGPDHQQQRRAWAPIVATGTVRCARCGEPIIGAFDLDHLDNGSEHPAHPSCNRRAGGQR